MLEKDMTMEDLLKNMDFIKRIYEVARIVDPVKNQVLNYQDNKLVPLSSKCYDVWERNQLCDNCISRKALRQDETYAKIEYLKDRVYMVLAMPIHLKEEKVILELLRDITEERVLFDSPDHCKSDAYSLLSNRNANIIKDGLTKIFNNRYINERLPYDIINSYIKKQYLSIIIIDIDDFKEINKRYGHGCGNKVLREFAQVLEENTKKNNAWVARYTADTFIAVLTHHSPKEIKDCAQSLRTAIQQHDFISEQTNTISITSSLGVYTQERVEESMEQIIVQAKLLLKQAKTQGKNCMVANEKVGRR